MKSRYICPNCGRREFVRYVDNSSGEYVSDTVGKCNRIEKCGYHLPPRIFFENENIHVDYKPITRKPITKPTYFFPENILTESLHSEEHRSSLFKFFQKYFEDEKIEKCFRKYLVGVDKNREDAVIFWQVDREKKVRAGKIMKYDIMSGRRRKDFFSWVKKEENSDSEIRQCFYGIHLIDYFKNYRIGIVESEKTALLCDLYFDEKIVWLASGGLNGFNEEKCKDLVGRTVILLPDLSSEKSKTNASQLWFDKAITFEKKLNIRFIMNGFLEKNSDEKSKENQEDLADYIIAKIEAKKKDVQILKVH